MVGDISDNIQACSSHANIRQVIYSFLWISCILSIEYVMISMSWNKSYRFIKQRADNSPESVTAPALEPLWDKIPCTSNLLWGPALYKSWKNNNPS